jgi:transposase
MPNTDAAPNRPTAIAGNDAALLVSLEPSQSSWLITVLQPDRQGFAKFTQPAGETDRLLATLWQQSERAERRVGGRVITIYEAGLDGFWLHRVLGGQRDRKNHVVDAGSVAAPRRGRRAKSDRPDGEAFACARYRLAAGEPRVCSMVAVPSVADEARRLSRERQHRWPSGSR